MKLDVKMSDYTKLMYLCRDLGIDAVRFTKEGHELAKHLFAPLMIKQPSPKLLEKLESVTYIAGLTFYGPGEDLNRQASNSDTGGLERSQ